MFSVIQPHQLNSWLQQQQHLLKPPTERRSGSFKQMLFSVISNTVSQTLNLILKRLLQFVEETFILALFFYIECIPEVINYLQIQLAWTFLCKSVNTALIALKHTYFSSRSLKKGRLTLRIMPADWVLQRRRPPLWEQPIRAQLKAFRRP